MEVLLQDYGAWRAHATKLYGDFLLSLSLTPMTTTTAAAVAAFLILSVIILHSHIHCDLHHSCSTLTQHDLHLLLYPRKPHLPQTSIEGNSPPTHTHSWQHYSFQISRQLSNLPPSFQTYRRRGGRSRDQKSGGGNFTLGKIFTSPGPDPSLYYWRSACGLLASRLHNQRRCLLRHT